MTSRSIAALGLAGFFTVGLLGGCSSAATDGSTLAELEKPAEPLTELPDVPEDFAPTEQGEELSFGQSAEIVSTNFDTGAAVFWEVTVGSPKRLTPAEVEDNIGQDPGEIGLPEPEEGEDPPTPERYRSFTCYPVSFTPVGLPAEDVSVALPNLRLTDSAGLNANTVDGGGNTYCGLEEDDELPAYSGDMEVGRDYTQALVTWEGANDPGIVGTVVELSTPLSPANEAQPPQLVRWR